MLKVWYMGERSTFTGEYEDDYGERFWLCIREESGETLVAESHLKAYMPEVLEQLRAFKQEAQND